jgi:hypothetical protein
MGMEIICKIRGRIASESGSVGVVVALVIFFAVGMLTMTWNTAQLSKAKMRLQNAADSAALAHAVCQARGMNAVQNINDEMYESLKLSASLREFARYMEITALVCEGFAKIPGPVGLIARAIALAAHTAGALFGGIGGWLAKIITRFFLKSVAWMYAKTSAFFGVWNAQQLAAQNEATPIVMTDTGQWPGKMKEWFEDWKIGFYAGGIGVPHATDTLFLPLMESGKDEVKKAPWKVDKIDIFEETTSPWKSIYKFFGTGDAWEVKPYVSKRGDQEGLTLKDGKVTSDDVLPSPAIWVAFKWHDHVLTLPLDSFFNEEFADRIVHKSPILAISAAQCVTGDVIPHSKKSDDKSTNQRPAGFGAGATAKLVPVATVMYKKKKALGRVFDALVYH